MKRILASFGWAFLLLPLFSIAGIRHEFTGRGSDTEIRPVSSFSSVSSAGSFEVFISMGSKESLRLEGPGESLSKVETRVENGILKIGTKKGTRKWRWADEKIKVFITAKRLTALTASGLGTIKVNGTIRTNRFESKVSGSGNIAVAVASKHFIAVISGSGKITAEGNAGSASVVISGSGSFNGQKLRSASSDIKISGSGNAYIHANDLLSAAISGSGRVYYAGNARVNSSTSGSGKIRRL